MGRESETGRFRGRGRYQGRGRGLVRGYFNKSSSSGSYNLEEVKFMKIFIKQVFTYTSVKEIFVQKVQKFYEYEVASSLRDIEEYYMEGERPTIIMIL